MARLSTVNNDVQDTTAINLSVLLARLHAQLDTPDVQTERNLRTLQRERDKVGKNIEYANTLLVKLEQDAQSIKVQSKKQQTQLDLVNKRDQIKQLQQKLGDYNELAQDPVDDDSEGEDLLGEDTPSEDTQSQASHAEPISTSSTPPREETPPPFAAPPAPAAISLSVPPPPAAQPDQASILRARHKAERAELLTPAATTSSFSTSTAEALLTHHRTEQEDLTDSLLKMARALKESSHAFNTSLEQEKDILDSATKGLDKNELGLEAAQRRMGSLRSMAEGTGFWGRLMLYAWIAGLAVIAILVVFVMPKLRF